MQIPRDLRPADPPVRRRPAEPARAADKPAESAGGTPADRAQFGDAEAIGRYVTVLKTMNPASLHRVEDLRARIADGSYNADPEELADLLLGDRASRDPASAPRRPV